MSAFTAANTYEVDTPRFQLVPVSLRGRFMTQTQEEHACETIEMSPGEISLLAHFKVAPGEKVVIYLEEVGRFVGIVSHRTPDGFVVAIDLTAKKRDMLADQLTWLANRRLPGLADERRHERITPFMRRVLLRGPNQLEEIVTIVNVSASGVALETPLILGLGLEVVVGNTPARVVRHFSGGFACEFLVPLDESKVNESIRL